MTKPEKGNQNSTSKSRLNSFLYKIKRDVYNEESFQQEYRKTAPSTGTMNTDVATIRHQVLCHCSWHKFLRCMVTIFPFLEWMCLYRFKDWLLGDLLAGLSVGLVQVPQGLVLSLLTRQLVPPLNVAYAAFCSSVVYVIFGSCHQMSIGPFFLVSALMINVLKEKPFNKGHLILGTFLKDDFTVPSYFDNYNKSLSVVAATTFLTGLIQLSMGLLGMGFMATYLPEAVISAYLAAVALHLVLSQLPCVFGVMITFHAGPVAFFYNILNYCVALPKANSTSILLFLTAVVALRINKCIRISFNHYPIEFPMELFLILGFTVFANKIDMATENSKTFAEMTPFRFLFPTLPDFTIFGKVVLQSISLSLVSSFLLIFLGKRIASFHNYRVNSNQDLIAIGLCNVISSCFRTSVFTGAMARTIIQDKSGGRQQFASLVGAGVMLLLMVKVGSFFYELPNAVLAAIILSNVIPYLEAIYNLPSLWRQDQYDCVAWMVTFTSTIFLGLDMGLLVSLLFSFFIITVRSHRTEITRLGQIPNTNIYKSITDYREFTNIPGVKIFQCCNAITFINVHYLKHRLLRELGMVTVPLQEEELFGLFNQSHTSLQEEKICKCFCDCEDLEPPPRIAYTERYEYQEDFSSSSGNLIHCTPLEPTTLSQKTSDEETPSQRYHGEICEDVGKGWPSSNTLQKSVPSPQDPGAAPAERRLNAPCSDVTVQPATHTIILDFSLVHYVDSQALVILRQMCNAFQNASILVLFTGCHSCVLREFEKNDFFDDGITKAHLFLSLHDAVLFALSRNAADGSELSVEEGETVLQETYSEPDKAFKRQKTGTENDKSRYEKSCGFLESSRNTSQRFPKVQKPKEESLAFDLGLDDTGESAEPSGLDLSLDLDQVLDNELGLEPELEPHMDLEWERQPDPRSRAHVYPPQHFRPMYHAPAQGSQPQLSPRMRSAEKRQKYLDSDSPEGSKEEVWEVN
ncbi:testis anion transporter 1 isoform X1 [Fukomys damarensis]|uniref:testis anion transporter 1 isoform X1 n=2 Tax=Fukomys damarensis TaxID=885580 RepID=UPI00053F2A8D|nr:testis anion transporter 1 isoform X1 [Fukomys damarensis]XP_010603653.1 testis anion transporter 1 isoform X1 [Fukomys damarensis]